MFKRILFLTLTIVVWACKSENEEEYLGVKFQTV